MANFDGLRRVDIESRHLNDANLLVAEAGWNQTPDDWRVFMRASGAIGFEDQTGRLVASAAAIPYGREFGWISMVLVTAAWQRKGIATDLLHACIANHRDAGRVPVLDATPDGEKVYAGLGFLGQFEARRWQSAKAAAPTPPGDDRPRMIAGSDVDGVVDYDRVVFGGDRAIVVRDFVTRNGARGWIAPGGCGFLLSRKGRLARQIGPLCAETEVVAMSLLATALHYLDEPVFIDVPERHEATVRLLKKLDFVAQRPFRRMALGRAAGFGDAKRMFALAGPEFG